MTDGSPTIIESRGKKWLGVLLSLFVPGFGLLRAGYITRAALWFFAVLIIGLLAILLFTLRGVPSWVVLCGLSSVLLCQFGMLKDSFRPGKIHVKHWGLVFAVAFVVMMLIPSASHLWVQTFFIPNASMEPTLRGPTQGKPDQFIVDRLAYRFSPPKRGDLVVVRMPSATRGRAAILSVRRVVGLPGENVQISGGHLLVDGRQIGERDGIPPVNYEPPPLLFDASKTGIYAVPPHCYFVLGDQPSRSIDSRYLGPLPETRVYGRVARIYYPFSRCGVPR